MRKLCKLELLTYLHSESLSVSGFNLEYDNNLLFNKFKSSLFWQKLIEDHMPL